MTAGFSLFALFTAGLASVATAYTTPTTGPVGNPIFRPSLGERVPVGQPFAITWEPTCEGTVTILLLRGPSENVVPLYPIIEKTPNTGTFSWSPATELEDDVSHYGLQLICDATGEFQWSTQFGILNSQTPPVSSTPVSSATPVSETPAVSVSETPVVSVSEPASSSPVVSRPVVESSSHSAEAEETPVIIKPANVNATYASGSMPTSTAIVSATGSLSVPSSLRPVVSPSSSADEGLPESATENSAGRVGLGLGLLAGTAGFLAFVL